MRREGEGNEPDQFWRREKCRFSLGPICRRLLVEESRGKCLCLCFGLDSDEAAASMLQLRVMEAVTTHLEKNENA